MRLGFENTEYTVIEGNELSIFSDIQITRSSASEQTYELEIISFPGGFAEEGVDFNIITKTVQLPPDVSSVNVSVEIIGDRIIELTEDFSLAVRRVSGSAQVLINLERAQTTVSISDDDGGT